MCDVLICKCCHTCTFSLLLSLLLWFFWVFLLSVVFLDIFHFLCCLVLPLNPLWDHNRCLHVPYKLLPCFFAAFTSYFHWHFFLHSFFFKNNDTTSSNEVAPKVHWCHGANPKQWTGTNSTSVPWSYRQSAGNGENKKNCHLYFFIPTVIRVLLIIKI